MRRLLALLLALAAPVAVAPPAGAAALTPLTIAGTWASEPVHAASPVGDPRLFVVERGGVVRIMVDGVLRSPAFLTVPNVDTTSERGLLSIAFPIDFASKGRFYVFATIAGTPVQTQVIEYRVSGSDPDLADPASARVVLTQDLTAANHIGGQLAFGADRTLYATLGDNTAPAKAQTDDTYLGKVLRIDPSDPDGVGPQTFTVPADNPTPGSAIWARGLRNPYRASFDLQGRLIISDVGEAAVEEVNVGVPGANYGWPDCEGACANARFTNPFHSYLHTGAGQGCSIIGGVSVRDLRLTAFAGRYLFGDFCQGDARSIDLGPSGPAPRTETISPTRINRLIGFAEDARGCPYVLGNGTIARVVASAGDGKACGLGFVAASAYPPPSPTPVATPAAGPTPTPGPTPGPVAPPTAAPASSAGAPSVAATPTPPAVLPTATPNPTPFVIPRNCVREGQTSIRSSKGTITAARLVTGKRTKVLRFKRRGVRAELRGLPTATRLKVRITIRTKRGRILNETKTFRACP